MNGGPAYQWNGFQMPIRFGDATNVIYTHGYQIYQYTDGARRGYDEDKYLLMYGALDGGNGLDFWHYIAQVLTNGQEIEIFREDDPNKNIALIISRIDSAQIRFASRVYGTYTWLPVGNEVIYVSPSWGVDPPPGRDLISPPTMNIGFCTNGTKFNLYVTQQWGTWSDDPYYDDNGYWLNCLQNANSMSTCIAFLLAGNVPIPPTSDPYSPGGTSTTDPTSTGDFDAESDAIEADAITTLSPVDAGFIVLYAVDRTNIRTFVNYLFTGADLTNIKKLWASPRESIVCLNYFPFTPSGAALTPSDIMFAAGDSGADGRLITKQYEELDFGSVTLNEYYGSCLDYSPQTTVQLILPFTSGSVDLDPDEFMGKTIGVKCRVDVYTGAALYLIDDGTSVLLQVPCTLANPLPWSASDYSSLISSLAGVVATGVGALIAIGTGGTGTPAALAIAGAATANIASNVMGAKLHYQHGGAGGTGTGMFGIQKPYLIIKRPRQCLPADNNKFQGYPTMATFRMGTLSGFTKVHQIHLDIPQATDAERKELEAILKGGVWI